MRQERAEEGFLLLTVLFLVALVLIALAVAAPSMARSIQREKEIELVHRGEQYKRAIKLYYKKYGAYPTSIDQLVQTNNIRFLRKRYTDPITGKDDWRLIHLGQAKVPPMGLFGQPLMGIPGQTPVNGQPATASATSATAFGTSSVSPGAGSTDQSDQDSFGSNSDSGDDSGTTGGSSTGTNFSGTTTGTQPNATTPGATSPTGGTAGAASSSFGATLGGGPIVGVGIPSTKKSLIEYKKQKTYNKWEFVYNPIEDQMQGMGLMGAATANTNGTGTGTGITSGTTGTFGQSNGSSDSGFGTSGGTTSTPTSPTPQQQQ